MVERIVKYSKTNSFFLFGPRATGKTTLIQSQFDSKNCLHIDLLQPEIFERLEQKPSELLDMISARPKIEWVVIDEIQKIPELLNLIHILDQKNKKLKFVMTGSSARKLKKGAANLLAGRAFRYLCHPLTSVELKDAFDLETILKFGSLPKVLDLNVADKKDFLRTYVETYFKEEIVAEQIVRNLRPFKNFLNIAAQMNGQIININKIAKDVGVEHATVQNYFEILEDTLVGFMLEPYHQSIRKRQRQQSKFYYFDLGVQRALTKQLENTLVSGTSEYGNAFEHFLILEIKRLIDYRKPDWSMSYLSTKDDAEIDLIIERPGMKNIALEIKSVSNVNKLDQRKLNATLGLFKSLENFNCFVFSKDPVEKVIDNVRYIPWNKGLKEIGLG